MGFVYRKRRRNLLQKPTKPTSEKKESRISPAALALAKENNLIWDIISGTGKDGVITVKDVKMVLSIAGSEEE